jgi:uncharacterized protein YecE (DUF72 family)
MSAHGRFRIGTSGWIYRHWRGVFYPPKRPVHRWFAFYNEHFDTVEINNTFYRLPSEDAFDEWERQAGPGFLYAVKASRFLTHMKKLKDPADSLERILGRSRRLGPHLGPVLYQLPPNWHCNPERLRHFLELLPLDLQHVFEFRDPTWYREEVRGLLTAAGVGFCQHDLRGASSPDWVTGPLVYVRFHGPTEVAYAGSYPKAVLRRWARRIDEYLRSGLDVYVYFNNDHNGYAITNAQELRSLMGAAALANRR